MSFWNPIYQELISSIDTIDIPGFLREEAAELIQKLNPHKIENIHTYQDLFTDFLLELDAHHSSMYMKNTSTTQQRGKVFLPKHYNYYYISPQWRKSLNREEKTQWLQTSTEEKSQKATIIRGIFLLSLCDFSQWSSCRLRNKYYYKIEPRTLFHHKYQS